MPSIGTINEEGVNVDLYIPRKCHATNSLITSFDYAAIQIAIADVDPNGVYNGTTKTFCIAGYLRDQGESDHAINRLSITNGLIRIKTGKKPKAKANQKKIVKVPAKIVAKSAAPVKGGKGAAAKGPRTAGARPAGKRPAGAKPTGEKKAAGEKPTGDKPVRPRGPRPAGKKAAAPKKE